MEIGWKITFPVISLESEVAAIVRLHLFNAFIVSNKPKIVQIGSAISEKKSGFAAILHPFYRERQNVRFNPIFRLIFQFLKNRLTYFFSVYFFSKCPIDSLQLLLGHYFCTINGFRVITIWKNKFRWYGKIHTPFLKISLESDWSLYPGKTNTEDVCKVLSKSEYVNSDGLLVIFGIALQCLHI